ncbi:MAG TPA: isoprenylcysteine carboxylmethyltransferase family protein [Anaerolineales bacterium]|nr:isoprenylcysteine carboxylmethyltransferase family protein [Anaerolineales bacterium]
MTDDSVNMRTLTRRTSLLGITFALVLGAVFFGTAGTLAYWQAWVYMGSLMVPMIFVARTLLRKSPGLLDRRLQVREREPAQKAIVSVGTTFLLAAFILPGLDRRWGWSSVPAWAVIAADLVMLVGYGLIIRVFRENPFASRTVEVTEEQKVITSGPYAIVRHPMYVGVLIFYLASPMALGSWWALLPASLIVPILIMRILNEEKVLERDLAGYSEYKQRTRYRLLPGIW